MTPLAIAQTNIFSVNYQNERMHLTTFKIYVSKNSVAIN